ncbi:MAG TPA: 3-deoxy-manno-octulosonate cytidylyltransferase [Gammaproteobacteria bacterium]
MTPRFNVVIPARYESARLPGKALADIGGKPMVLWTYDAARRSAAAEVMVATDDERVAAACRGAGARVELTANGHASGTDRIAEVAARSAWDERDIIVNVQGDEPLMPPKLIDQAALLLDRHPTADLATLMTDVRDARELADPNVVKVVVDSLGFALYFSRAPIPSPRDGGLPPGAKRHIGLYAYRAGSLKKLAASPPCELEQIERLEQLRALWLGQRIVLADAIEIPLRGVDTEADLAAVRRVVARR